MGRYTFPAFKTSSTLRYVIVWGLQWQIIECSCLAPGTDLLAAMTAAMKRLHGEGWEAEGTPEYGFVFVRREKDRRLLMLTERDPHSTVAQSFSPFRRS
jgi:hypothetical protein